MLQGELSKQGKKTKVSHLRSVSHFTNKLDPLEMVKIREDIFYAISDWYHYAILEMTYLKRRTFSAKQIATELRCSYQEIDEAIKRLKRLGFLEEKNKRWVKSQAHITTGSDFSSIALRRLQLQFLEKAKQSLLIDPIEERDLTSMTMAIDSTKLHEAKKKITKFRRELCQFLETGNRDRLYTLTVNLFPLTHREKKK